MTNMKNEKTEEPALQFLIVLLGVDPLVWRRIRVPTHYSFWDLHVAIQDAMGWLDYHLHEFKMNNQATGEQIIIGMPDDEDLRGIEILPDYAVPISEYFMPKNEMALYTYDFGDGWRHLIAYEDYLRSAEGVHYPQCVSGAMRCPPEDCGGSGGYELFLKAIRNPDHEEHEMYLTWIGGSFDPEDFDPGQVVFHDPEERLRIAYEDV